MSFGRPRATWIRAVFLSLLAPWVTAGLGGVCCPLVVPKGRACADYRFGVKSSRGIADEGCCLWMGRESTSSPRW